MDSLVNKDDPFPRKLTENLWVLGNYFFNLYLVTFGKKSALIELGVSAIVDSVIDQLNYIGMQPDYLVMTHPHADHITGLMGLTDRFPQAKLIVGEGAYDFISHPKGSKSIIEEDQFMTSALAKMGIQSKRPAITSLSLPKEKIEVRNHIELDLDGVKMICDKVEGHAPGSIVAFFPELKTLIASDSLGFHFNGRCFLPLYFTNFKHYEQSLQKISQLEPAFLGIGHQSPFVGDIAENAIKSSIHATSTFHQNLLNDIRSDDLIIHSLIEENYRDEFLVYSPDNIENCFKLLLKRSKEADPSDD